MKIHAKRLLISSLFSLFSITATDLIDWKLNSSKEDIQVFSASVGERKFHTFRVQGSFHESATALSNTVNNTALLAEWFPYCENAKVVDDQTSDEMIVYMVFDFPFPLKDRDAYLKVSKSMAGDGEVRYNLNSLNGYALNPDYIRMGRIESQSLFKEIDNEVQFEQTIYLDPAGSITNFFLKSGVPPVMVKSFRRLAKLLK